jgi:DNA-binding HxlR family transcriptional regulator
MEAYCRINYALKHFGDKWLLLIIWSGTFDGQTAAGQNFLDLAKNDKPALIMDLAEKLTRRT